MKKFKNVRNYHFTYRNNGFYYDDYCGTIDVGCFHNKLHEGIQIFIV